jgi:transcriptional regulator with XRE-family HTH domain
MEKKREQELLQKLGERLKELRTAKGFTLEQLAYEAEIELSQVHRIEKGKINPKYTTLQILAEALKTDVSHLLKGL